MLAWGVQKFGNSGPFSTIASVSNRRAAHIPEGWLFYSRQVETASQTLQSRMGFWQSLETSANSRYFIIPVCYSKPRALQPYKFQNLCTTANQSGGSQSQLVPEKSRVADPCGGPEDGIGYIGTEWIRVWDLYSLHYRFGASELVTCLPV